MLSWSSTVFGKSGNIISFLSGSGMSNSLVFCHRVWSVCSSFWTYSSLSSMGTNILWPFFMIIFLLPFIGFASPSNPSNSLSNSSSVMGLSSRSGCIMNFSFNPSAVVFSTPSSPSDFSAEPFVMICGLSISGSISCAMMFLFSSGTFSNVVSPRCMSSMMSWKNDILLSVIGACASACSLVNDTSARYCALLLSSLSIFNSPSLMSSNVPFWLWNTSSIFFLSSSVIAIVSGFGGVGSCGLIVLITRGLAFLTTSFGSSIFASGSMTSVKSGLFLSGSITSSICSEIVGSLRSCVCSLLCFIDSFNSACSFCVSSKKSFGSGLLTSTVSYSCSAGSNPSLALLAAFIMFVSFCMS